jgi:hypothetical protein
VSTAYYALFHFLTGDFAAHWKTEAQRARIARVFDHKKMKDASQMVGAPYPKHDPKIVRDLKKVAGAFSDLQQHRYTADYDSATNWSRTDVLEVLQIASDAFMAWRAIRKDEIAQDYLILLLYPRREK